MDNKNRDEQLSKEMRAVNGQSYDDVMLEETSGIDINGNGIVGVAHDSNDEKESVIQRLEEKLEIIAERDTTGKERAKERDSERSRV